MFSLENGSKVKLEIRKMGINGEGIGYFNRLAIFVPRAITKEIVNCEIVELYDKYAVAKLEEVVKPSNRRVEPPCKFYEQCGGCQLQHVEYKEQLKAKLSLLKQSLSRYTSLDIASLKIRKALGLANNYHYRNKSQRPFKNTNFGLALGLFRQGTNQFVYVDTCMTEDEHVNQINQEALTVLRKYHVMASDQMNKEGILLNLVTRYLASTETASVTFIVTDFDPVLKEVAKDLMAKNPSVVSVTYSVNKKNNPMMFGPAVELLAGKPYITDLFSNMKIRISPDAFHQLNTAQMKVLYDEIVKAAELEGKETVIDAYSGIGMTSLMMAKKAKRVIGIDYSPASIADATKNATANGIKNVSFICDHVEGALPKLIANGVKPDILVLDPPRAGLPEEIVKLIVKTKIKKIIYVSCNPSTLAKNIAGLESKYEVCYIQPLDMFPHTANVESVTLLKLKESGGANR